MMWSVWLSGVVAIVLISFTHWVRKWRNPKCNGKLPPGSMGLPLIGETLEFLIPNKSLDIPPFIKKRMKRYGPLFRTSLVGRSIVVSSDPEFNYFIFQQEGKLVELWYLDSFAKLLRQDTLQTATGYIHKYLRNIILASFGPENLKDKLLPELEATIFRKMKDWSKLPSVEVKSAISAMVFDFTAKVLFSYEAETSGENNLGESFTNYLQGLMSLPLNIPGTAFHRCLQNQKRAVKLIRKVLEERKRNPNKGKVDFLDQIVADMEKETFLTEEFVVYMMFGLLLASFETISATLALTVKLVLEHPSVVQELTEEHVEILKNRGNDNSGLTWMEYRSMTFTHYVTSESLRLASVAPGILRRVIQDIEVNGYTIPKGWAIMVVPAALQLNPDTYEDPLAFNPNRWKDMGSNATAKNFIAFGGGSRTCAGAEFSKALIAVFLHVFVTKFRSKKLKGGEVCRTPALGFGSGVRIQISEKIG